MQVRLEPLKEESAGWQLLDARTGALIEEGPWVNEPTESEVPIPPEDGDYRVLVSTVSPERGWAYARGASMRVVDVAMRAGAATVMRDRHTTLAALRWLGLPGRIGTFLVEPWTVLWRNRSLITAMVERDLEGRYKGSFGDRFWSLAQPLLLMLAYWFVFGIVLQTRFDNKSDSSTYVLFFLCGMLPWLAFSEALGRAPNVILEHRNFVKKLVFPVEILPVNLVFSGVVSSGLALIVYLFFLMATRERIPPEALWIPVLLIPQLMLTLGMCWGWAAIGLFARDLSQVNGFLLTLIFFLTPICYPTEKLPPAAVAILQKSPIYKLVGEYRLLFISEKAPDWPVMAQLLAMSVVIFYLGYGVFRKLRPSFPDVL